MGMAFIRPDWPAPARVKAFVTQRQGGVSLTPYHALNMALHVGDQVEHVLENRDRVAQALALPTAPFWLDQVHGIHAVSADDYVHASAQEALPEADGAWTNMHGRVLAILTADCLPIFITDRSGSFVMALHAGWRGLCDGIIQNALNEAGVSADRLMAWIGPGIGFAAYEISSEIRDAFLMSGQALKFHFKPSKSGNWLADLAGIALWQLEQLDVCWLGGGHWCTHERSDQFFSYRRDGITGRMASFIWLDA